MIFAVLPLIAGACLTLPVMQAASWKDKAARLALGAGKQMAVSHGRSRRRKKKCKDSWL